MRQMKYFDITELLAPEIIGILSVEACWMLIPRHVQYGLDRLRELYGASIVINNSNYKHSGIRTKDCAVGAKNSAHKCNRGLIAFDLKVADMFKLRNIIEDNYADLHISEVENYDKTESWTHLAFSAERPSKLRIINP